MIFSVLGCDIFQMLKMCPCPHSDKQEVEKQQTLKVGGRPATTEPGYASHKTSNQSNIAEKMKIPINNSEKMKLNYRALREGRQGTTHPDNGSDKISNIFITHKAKKRLHRACNRSPGNFFVTLSACLPFNMIAKD